MAIGDHTIKIGLSIGIETCCHTKTLSPDTLMQHADEAMYFAKHEKVSAYCFYTEDMEATRHFRMQMKKDLRGAGDRGELMLCYQPKQSLTTEKICGAEALLRWNHPERGIIYPADFMPVAEDMGVIEDIEKWVLSTVCEDIRRWRKKNLPMIPISVNISAQLFESPSFAESIEALLKSRQINAGQLSLELPEHLFLLPDKAKTKIFSRLYEAGIHITMDQFSVEKSSLQSLKALTLNEVKFGSRFIEDMEDKGRDMLMVRAVISCAHSLGLKVAACGVESEALRANLKNEHCDIVQGFIFSHPMAGGCFEEWLQNNDNILLDNEIIMEQRKYSTG